MHQGSGQQWETHLTHRPARGSGTGAAEGELLKADGWENDPLKFPFGSQDTVAPARGAGD